MTLGEQIYHLRTGRNLSQGELAEVLEVSRQSVSKWETDVSVPDLDKLVKLSEFFGVSLDELVKGEQPPAPEAEPVSTTSARTQIRVIIGAVLLGVALVGMLLWGLEGLLLLSPVVLCAVGCFAFKRRTALWCCWLVYLAVAVYIDASSVAGLRSILQRIALGALDWSAGTVISLVMLAVWLVLLLAALVLYARQPLSVTRPRLALLLGAWPVCGVLWWVRNVLFRSDRFWVFPARVLPVLWDHAVLLLFSALLVLTVRMAVTAVKEKRTMEIP